MPRFYLNLTILLFIATVHSQTTPDTGDGADVFWKDSLVLIENMIKDLSKEANILEQYQLFNRVERTYRQISSELSGGKRKELKRKLSVSFHHLPAPPELTCDGLPAMTLVKRDQKSFYWTDPVPERLLAEYLNGIEEDENSVHDHVDRWRSIKYDRRQARYYSENPDRPINGLSHEVSTNIAVWLSRQSNTHLKLPASSIVAGFADGDVTCWTSTRWIDRDPFRVEAWKMFGGEFWTIVVDNRTIGDLPEAFYPESQLRLVTSVNEGKKLYLSEVRRNED